MDGLTRAERRGGLWVRLAEERLVLGLLRYRYGVITLVLGVVAVPQFGRTDGDWGFFRRGSELLFGVERPYLPWPGGLQLYANYPEIQVGPLALLAATPGRLAGDLGWKVTSAVMLAAIVPLIWLLERTFHEGASRRQEAVVLVGGSLSAASWVSLAGAYLHLDDVLALATMVVACWAVGRGRPVLAGAMIGLGAASKPWAVWFLPMLAVGGPTSAILGVMAAGAVAGAAWLPFLVGDPGTTGAFRPQVDVGRASVLRLVGVESGLGPGWVRPVQSLGAVAAGIAAAARRRWWAVPVVVLSVRLLTDPGTYPYYGSGLMVGSLVYDLGARRRLPVASIVAFATVVVPGLGEGWPLVRAVLRALGCGALLVLALAPSPRGGRHDEGPTGGNGAAGWPGPKPAG